MSPHCGNSCYKLADLTQRGAPLPTTLQEPAGCDPPPGLESCGEKVWAGERTGRTGRSWRSATLCKPASPSLPLRQKPSTPLPCEMKLHSFQLRPPASAARQAQKLGSCAREGFPALLSPAFPSGALRPSKLRTGSRLHQESWLSRFCKGQ